MDTPEGKEDDNMKVSSKHLVFHSRTFGMTTGIHYMTFGIGTDFKILRILHFIKCFQEELPHTTEGHTTRRSSHCELNKLMHKCVSYCKGVG